MAFLAEKFDMEYDKMMRDYEYGLEYAGKPIPITWLEGFGAQ